MPIDQLAKNQMDSVTGEKIISELKAVKTNLESLSGNLTPEERQQYGSINERNKLIVGKVQEFHQQQPELQSPDVDWNKFDASWETRSFLATVENICHSILEMASDARILHDFDLYQMMLTDYDYTKYKSGSTTASGGYTTKHEEMKQFFGNPAGNNGSNTSDTNEDPK